MRDLYLLIPDMFSSFIDSEEEKLEVSMLSSKSFSMCTVLIVLNLVKLGEGDEGSLVITSLTSLFSDFSFDLFES